MTDASMVHRRSRRRGFTLIEVLVAMVILAIGLLALQAMAIGSARMIARADRQGEFTAIASAELESTLAAFRNGQAVVGGVRTEGRGRVTRTVTNFAPVAFQGGGSIQSVLVEVRVDPATGQNHLDFRPVTVVGRASR